MKLATKEKKMMIRMKFVSCAMKMEMITLPASVNIVSQGIGQEELLYCLPSEWEDKVSQAHRVVVQKVPLGKKLITHHCSSLVN